MQVLSEAERCRSKDGAIGRGVGLNSCFGRSDGDVKSLGKRDDSVRCRAAAADSDSLRLTTLEEHAVTNALKKGGSVMAGCRVDSTGTRTYASRTTTADTRAYPASPGLLHHAASLARADKAEVAMPPRSEQEQTEAGAGNQAKVRREAGPSEVTPAALPARAAAATRLGSCPVLLTHQRPLTSSWHCRPRRRRGASARRTRR